MLKIRQSGGFLGRLLGPLLKTGLPLTGNVLKSQQQHQQHMQLFIKKLFGSGNTTLIIWRNEWCYESS